MSLLLLFRRNGPSPQQGSHESRYGGGLPDEGGARDEGETRPRVAGPTAVGLRRQAVQVRRDRPDTRFGTESVSACAPHKDSGCYQL